MSRHRVYVTFFLRQGWQISFLKEDLKTSLRRKLTFADPIKLIQMHEQSGETKTLEARAVLRNAIENGRGGFYLSLTDEQVKKLS